MLDDEERFTVVDSLFRSLFEDDVDDDEESVFRFEDDEDEDSDFRSLLLAVEEDELALVELAAARLDEGDLLLEDEDVVFFSCCCGCSST